MPCLPHIGIAQLAQVATQLARDQTVAKGGDSNRWYEYAQLACTAGMHGWHAQLAARGFKTVGDAASNI